MEQSNLDEDDDDDEENDGLLTTTNNTFSDITIFDRIKADFEQFEQTDFKLLTTGKLYARRWKQTTDTVEPLYSGHLLDFPKVSTIQRCPL
ncbi:unnamed protein product [Didymodactylos carnosus]|uniref:Uncharacterized protein n=1 Tax=Didymodactylos carnosus TaxID=1234261 RepID=A0A8S2G4A9_9BILA|nr:unnamed protein product [Didymodactylos carnosus]CAF4439100.1 unnamed protein product [Didymodactylos carnosus]